MGLSKFSQEHMCALRIIHTRSFLHIIPPATATINRVEENSKQLEATAINNKCEGKLGTPSKAPAAPNLICG